MTRTECEELAPGMKCLIAEDFVEDPYDPLREFLGTIQTVDRIDFSNSGWVYFDGLPQPFSFSEIERIEYEAQIIDDESIPYQLGDIYLILGEV